MKYLIVACLYKSALVFVLAGAFVNTLMFSVPQEKSYLIKEALLTRFGSLTVFFPFYVGFETDNSVLRELKGGLALERCALH